MIITGITIKMVDHSAPEYPDPDAIKRASGDIIPFSDVLQCCCTTDDDQQLECHEFITKGLTPDYLGTILHKFAAAVSMIGQVEKAA